MSCACTLHNCSRAIFVIVNVPANSVKKVTCSYLSLRLILVNSTRPASMGSVSSPAEIIRRQSSYVWSVTGTPKALKADSLYIQWSAQMLVVLVKSWMQQATKMYKGQTDKRNAITKLNAVLTLWPSY